MARAFSFVFALTFCAVAFGQSFGRFGYTPAGAIPGWKISTRGFQADTAVSDTFLFAEPFTAWKPTSTSSLGQTVDLGVGKDGNPTQLAMDLSVPGFSLYFPKGMDLQIGTIGAPYLSWSEGSVEDGVSTPPSPWILVSFRQAQPPVLFAFPDGPHVMTVSGEPGRWHLRSLETTGGWVRVLMPFGLDARSTSTASELGELAKKVNDEKAMWSGTSPKLLDTKAVSDSGAITVTWSYDKPGALVPQAALLAGFGGYPLRVLTKIKQLESTSAEGPIAVTSEQNLSIRFPMIAWPRGRYVAFTSAVDVATQHQPAELDVAGAVDAAFQVLSTNQQTTSLSEAGSHLMAFLSHAQGDKEPFTGLRMPYAAAGTGYDLTAAHAFLTQALDVANGTPDLQNPLLSEIQARVDAYTWRPWALDENSWRRSAAIGAVAFAMRTKPEERVLGAMLQTSLSAERGLDLWHHWRGDLTTLPPHLEVMENLRQSVFLLQGSPPADGATSCLLSALRLRGPGQIEAIDKEGQLFLRWMTIDATPIDLQLSCPAGTKFAAAENVQKIATSLSGGITTLHCIPSASGFCAVKVNLPGGALVPVQAAQLYAEASH